ncbi:MAG TPA: ABC transporter substrate-binding protein [Methylomirabilota bacterium]|nr:ABC transporter substrate-binding protein [Methylomirabilota bacterium]
MSAIARRVILVAVLIGLLTAPLSAKAQPTAGAPRIGFLWGGAPSPSGMREFEEALRERGWIAGRNIIIEHRAAEGRNERLPQLAAELVQARVSVLVTQQSPSTLAAKKASGTIPIVMLGNGDPVRYGLVTNLARPEANVTGLSFLVDEVSIKMIELLREAIPKSERVAVFVNQTNPGAAPFLADLKVAAPRLGITVRPVAVNTVEELEAALAALQRTPVDAFFLAPESFIGSQRQRIIDFATARRWPVVSPARAFVDAGALMSYGPHGPSIFRQAAIYVDKLLRGAKPADLPVEQPTKFELVINLKAAKALGLTIQPSVLGRADQVIE